MSKLHSDQVMFYFMSNYIAISLHFPGLNESLFEQKEGGDDI